MTANRRIFLNIVATYVSPEGVARVPKGALCGVQIAVCASDWLVLRVVDAEDAWRGGSRADAWLSGGENGKMCDREDERGVKRWIAITLTC